MPAAARPTSCRRTAHPGGATASRTSYDAPARRRTEGRAALAARRPRRPAGQRPPPAGGRRPNRPSEREFQGGSALVYRLCGGRYHAIDRQEAVDHAVVAACPGRHTRLLKRIGVRLALVPEGVVLGGDDERRR